MKSIKKIILDHLKNEPIINITILKKHTALGWLDDFETSQLVFGYQTIALKGKNCVIMQDNKKFVNKCKKLIQKRIANFYLT